MKSENATPQENKAGAASVGAGFKATDSGAGLPAADSQSRGVPNNPAGVAPNTQHSEGEPVRYEDTGDRRRVVEHPHGRYVLFADYDALRAQLEEARRRECHHGWRGTVPDEGGRIVTPCPECGAQSLFIGSGGHLTCARVPTDRSDGCSDPSVEDVVRKLKQRAEAAEAALREARDKAWIPCSERLPEIRQHTKQADSCHIVFIASETSVYGGWVDTAIYGAWEFDDLDGEREDADDDGVVRGFGWHQETDDRNGELLIHTKINVTHWMPLPQPPLKTPPVEG